MSVVPDVSEDLSNVPVGGSGVIREDDESSQMDAEDSLPAPSLPMQNYAGLSNDPFVVSSSFTSKLQSLEQREIQRNECDVDDDFFSHLLVFYMIKEDWTKARQCRLRAEPLATNIHLNTLILISENLERSETGAAIHLIKNSNFDDPIKSLLREVQKRTILSVLRLVEHMYINIEATELARMLDAESNIELQKILNRIGWKLEDGYVVPKMTSQLVRKIKKMDESPFGPIHTTYDKVPCGPVSNDIDTLIQYGTFMETNMTDLSTNVEAEKFVKSHGGYGDKSGMNNAEKN
ncbi:unnamed protein product [Litomosoides sigmodontis]|uniref:CSN8/PSMD8/EIF3K domain-containing protein n=1 Tax=Litomosoides sigmodontis TaxID=42156 RepID=A0A3P6TTN3_LITSI|nr:unnamed protein product [Litomosoides sigmodontis]